MEKLILIVFYLKMYSLQDRNVERKYWMIIFDVVYDLLEGKEEAQELRTTLCRI